MCISFWLFDKHPAFWLVLALNRDEFKARPSLPVHLWEDEDDCKIVAGKDVVGRGTWLGITKTGRLAFLTNVREQKYVVNGGNERKDVISRGDLTIQFFKSHKSPAEYLEDVALEAHNYNGFNLVVADVSRGEMAFLSNRPEGTEPPKVHILTPGLHSLSNGRLNSDWPKMRRGKQKLESILSKIDEDLPSEVIVEQILQDRTKVNDVSVQTSETGCAWEFEHPMSSIFVNTRLFDEPYGTRSMSVVGIRRDGIVSFFEKSVEEGGVCKENSLQYQLEQQPLSV